MIDLLNLQPTKVTKDLKSKYLMIYGTYKAGKTTFATSIPNSLLLAFEHGFNGLEGIMAVDVPKWSDFNSILRQLEKKELKEKFDVIIIDTIDLMAAAAEKYVLAQNMSDSGEIPKGLSEIPWGGGYNQFKKLVDESLRKIAMMGYGVVLISHSKITTRTDEVTKEEYEYITCTLSDMTKLIANRFVDLICYIQADENGDRWLRTRDYSNKHLEVGSRFQYLDEKIPLNYQALVNALEKAINQEAEIKSKREAKAEAVSNGYLEEKPFPELLEEAKNVFKALIDKDKGNIEKINEIIVKYFGKPIKISTATEGQRELVELVLDDWKQLL